MKKIMLGLVAAFALASFAAPVRAEDAPAGDAAPAKKEKKSKKTEKTTTTKTDDTATKK